MDKIWWDGLPGQDGSKYLDGVAKDDPNAFSICSNLFFQSKCCYYNYQLCGYWSHCYSFFPKR
jgi:hypothetical protein